MICGMFWEVYMKQGRVVSWVMNNEINVSWQKSAMFWILVLPNFMEKCVVFDVFPKFKDIGYGNVGAFYKSWRRFIPEDPGPDCCDSIQSKGHI